MAAFRILSLRFNCILSCSCNMAEQYDEAIVDDNEDFSSDSDVTEDSNVMEEEVEEEGEDSSFFSFQLPDSGLCVAISPVDSFMVCVGCLDNSARLFRVDSVGAPQESVDLVGHTDSVASVAFSGDGSLVSTGAYDSSIKLWSVAVDTFGKELAMIEDTGSDIECQIWHPTEPMLIAGCVDGSVWVWKVVAEESGELSYFLLHMLRGHAHGSSVRSLNLLGKGSYGLLSTSEEGVGIVWNLKTAEVVHKTQTFPAPIVSASVHPTKPLFAIGLENGWTYVLHAESGKQLHKMKTSKPSSEEASGSVECVSFSACGQLLATATLDGILEVWHIDHLGSVPRHKIDHKVVKEHQGIADNEVGFTKLCWHPDSTLRCLVSVGKSGAVDVWNAMTGEHLTTLQGHTADVLDIAMVQFKDPQARTVARIVSVCDDGFVKMFTLSEE